MDDDDDPFMDDTPGHRGPPLGMILMIVLAVPAATLWVYFIWMVCAMYLRVRPPPELSARAFYVFVAFTLSGAIASLSCAAGRPKPPYVIANLILNISAIPLCIMFFFAFYLPWSLWT